MFNPRCVDLHHSNHLIGEKTFQMSLVHRDELIQKISPTAPTHRGDHFRMVYRVHPVIRCFNLENEGGIVHHHRDHVVLLPVQKKGANQ